jgi:hypothetical protein
MVALGTVADRRDSKASTPGTPVAQLRRPLFVTAVTVIEAPREGGYGGAVKRVAGGPAPRTQDGAS